MKAKIWVIIAVFVLAGRSGAAGVEYKITDLGTLGGSTSYANCINDSGQVVGVSSTASGDSHAFLWDYSDGMIDLGTLGGDTSDAYGINDDGQVVGYSGARAFLWDRYTGMTDLGTLGGIRSEAYAINDNGQVVGTSYPAGGDWHAFIWDDINGMTDLGTLSGFQSLAYAINNKEEVAGFSDGRAFLWDRYNGMTDLGTLGGDSSGANGMNETGRVVGWASDTNTEHTYHAFLWDPKEGMTDLGTLGGGDSEGYGINDAGQVVGWSEVIQPEHRDHAFVWDSNSGMVDLNNLLGSDSGWSYLEEACSINNHGQIVGSGITDTGQTHAFIIRPVVVVDAGVDIKPNRLNLASKGRWIMCVIQLPEDYNVADIEVESVLLEYEVQAASVRIDEQRQVAIARFMRAEVEGVLEAGEVEVTISGELADGTVFEGTDIIRVIDRGRKKQIGVPVKIPSAGSGRGRRGR